MERSSILELFNGPQTIENSRQYLLRTDILQKTVLECPWQLAFSLYYLRIKGKHYTVSWYVQQKLYLHFYNYDDILILLFFFNYNNKTAKEQIDLSFPLSWTANAICRLVQGRGFEGDVPRN